MQHDRKARGRSFRVGDKVFVGNYHQGEKWLPGAIQKKTGSVSYLIKLTDDGCYRRYHQDLLRKRCVDVDTPPDPDSSVEVDIPIPSPEIPVSDPESEVPMNVSPGESSPPVTDPPSENTDKTSSPESTINLVLHPIPSRHRKPVVRYEPTW